ncbi:relaxase/mobilization nuclease domain-containing protein [Sarcina sp. DSM 11001]|uniref:relaxase/mobilization nuclease domain-containing protein n=1 Tax=Sarcina sp. DSM 11001 TaxID=1798184 RepID=UPI000B849286|nr:relaxase/mobilization nuclease domain-containing protein [Sarcina sp. DSM 11001]
MDLCQREGLHQVDLLAPAKQKVSDREYRAAQRGQEKLDARNREILDAGATPRRTKFQTQKQVLRDAINECVDESTSFEQFRSLLFSRYQVKVKESRGRISYILPDREKPIRGRALGVDYEKESILQRLEQNLADWRDRKDYKINQDNIEKEAATDNSSDLDGLRTSSTLITRKWILLLDIIWRKIRFLAYSLFSLT